MELRRTTYSFAEQQLAGHIRSVLKTLLRTSSHKLKSVVCGVEVCKPVFVWAHGFSSANFNRVHAAFNKDYRKANPLLVRVWLECQLFPCLVVFVLQDKMHAELRIKVLNVNTRTGTAKRWLAQWLLLMRHNPPNADSVKAQISKISPDVLFAQYALFAEQAREVPLLQKGFSGLFSVMRS